MSPMAPDDPLAGIARDTRRSLIDQARLFIDPFTQECRATPPQRGGQGTDGYVSGRDVEQWPDRVARFRDKWIARPQPVRDAILRLAFPHHDNTDTSTGDTKNRGTGSG